MKKKKICVKGRFFLFCLVILLCACSRQKADSGFSSAGSARPVVLTFNNFTPETTPLGMGVIAAAKYAEEKSGGTLKLEVYHNGTLLGFDDSIQGTANGIADITMVGPAATDAQTLLNQVFSSMLEFIPEDRHKASAACQQLIRNVPELNQELEAMGLRWLSVHVLPGSNLHMSNREVSTIDQVRGVKIDGLGNVVSYWSSLGASALTLDPADYYLSLERGLIQGQYTHWALLDIYKTGELTKYHTVFGADGGGLSNGVMGYMINQAKWNSLSEEHKRILVEACDYAGTVTIDIDVPVIEQAKKTSRERGDGHVYINTPELLKPWIDAMKPVRQVWIDQTQSAGYPAQAAYDELVRLYNEYR
jgi:C4-dicarboxylate-binding protein DctP